jgi:hypothetical protein
MISEAMRLASADDRGHDDQREVQRSEGLQPSPTKATSTPSRNLNDGTGELEMQ